MSFIFMYLPYPSGLTTRNFP